ncbi:MAG: helix-turn-helix transcriptional regulator [Bacteroidales bacterium]|nr:helix-turn-helix transcriptional regulator [Bacteroidales bacterium]MDO5316791.1 helix-turn-helix transcriptional regulator [bacterium]
MELKLREIREQHHLSQEETAEKMHISQSAYARFELSKTKVDLERLELFAEAMGMSLIDVLTFPFHHSYTDGVPEIDLNASEMTIQITVKDPQKLHILEMLLGNVAH